MTKNFELIGSVYETMMGFNLEVAAGRSIAIKPTKPHGAPTTINLEGLLAAKPADRAKWLKEQTDQSLTGQAATGLKEAQSPEDAVAALERKLARDATPNIVPPGAMVLQPSDERRRSGSHYTPRTLTEPIVRTTLRPILERLGPNPRPQQVLDLKVCDPAMGSGAFLVEACRQLAESLVLAWHAHDCVPTIPPDEDEILHARRIVAQRCLYGVDKNPMAVDLAKLSLWLATLAKDHAFTFLDHALRCGDSLVGLTKIQILGFHWKPDKQRDFSRSVIEGQIQRAMDQRRQIREAPEGTPDALLREKLQAADGFINQARRYGDLIVSAFFAGTNDRQRKEELEILANVLAAQQSQFDINRHARLEKSINELHFGAHPIAPFHWEIEFPEVLDRANPGFDVIIGNPPFAGVTSLADSHREGYTDLLRLAFEGTGGKCDIVAFFFRQASKLLRENGAFDLIATNTIAQGDTRRSGLSTILMNGGIIFCARTRVRWPGSAAVVVSVIHVIKNNHISMNKILDEKVVNRISAFLLDSRVDDDPPPLIASSNLAFLGSKVHGIGFVFDDANPHCPPDSRRIEVLNHCPGAGCFIRPYVGGEELTSIVRPDYPRWVIDFGDIAELEARRYAELLEVVEEYVKPQRLRSNGPESKRWWQHGRRVADLYRAISGLSRIICIPRNSNSFAFTFLNAGGIVNDKIVAFASDRNSLFCVLQSKVHETWCRFLCGTLKDDLQYSPTDCLVNFPFPYDMATSSLLEDCGKCYDDFRAALMIKNNEGLTKTYNRFHDPDEGSPDILKLRELHAAMDRAVLDAYGWTDLKPNCEFLLDYEEDDEDEEQLGGRRRTKPWRYRWSDDFRDKVLARLLELNHQRAAEERLSGAAAETGRGKPTKKSTGRRKTGRKNTDQPELFGG